jgi:hypothetical protein
MTDVGRAVGLQVVAGAVALSGAAGIVLLVAINLGLWSGEGSAMIRLYLNLISIVAVAYCAALVWSGTKAARARSPWSLRAVSLLLLPQLIGFKIAGVSYVTFVGVAFFVGIDPPDLIMQPRAGIAVVHGGQAPLLGVNAVAALALILLRVWGSAPGSSHRR